METRESGKRPLLEFHIRRLRVWGNADLRKPASIVMAVSKISTPAALKERFNDAKLSGFLVQKPPFLSTVIKLRSTALIHGRKCKADLKEF